MATEARPQGQLTLTQAQLQDRLQVSRSTLHKLRAEPGFPAPIISMHNCVRWSAADIDDWLSRRGR